MISAAVGRGGETMISAQTTEAFWNAVQHVKPLSVGLNCSLGPDLMYPFLEELSEKADVAISCYPNAGLPNPLSETGFDLGPRRHGPLSGRLRARRADQYRRRLLRQHSRAHRGYRESARRPASAKVGDAAPEESSAARARLRVERERVGERERGRVHEAEAASSLGIAALHPAARRLHHDRRADQRGRFAEVRASSSSKANTKKR